MFIVTCNKSTQAYINYASYNASRKAFSEVGHNTAVCLSWPGAVSIAHRQASCSRVTSPQHNILYLIIDTTTIELTIASTNEALTKAPGFLSQTSVHSVTLVHTGTAVFRTLPRIIRRVKHHSIFTNTNLERL